MAKLFEEHKPEAVINCAAETHVDRSILVPEAFAKTDVVGTATLLEQSRKSGIDRFVQISTDEVYGSVEQGSSKESDALSIPAAPIRPVKPALTCLYSVTGPPIAFPS